MVLQATPEICELNGRDWSGYAAVLIGMKFVFARIDQNAIAIYVTLIVDWFIWLSAVVEGDGIGPYVLLSLAYFLPVVLPMHALPVKIIIDAVFETGPDRGARVGGRSIDDNRACGRTTAVVDPVFASAFTFLICARDVVSERACIPNVDCAIEFLDIVFGYECR